MEGKDLVSNHHATKVRTPVGDEVAQPVRATGVTRWRVERACRKQIGHCWHPADAMIAWFCCECGSERDGMPPHTCRLCSEVAER